MIYDDKEYIWVEKYRPKDVKRCILPENIKTKAEKFIEDGQIQNMLFYSGPGTGKSTLAMAMCHELDLDYIMINGSREGRLIETVRNTVTNFANTMSLSGKNTKKIVIYDEFDNAGGDVQMAIRGLMDDVSASCRFIFTGNYITKIIEPLKSRTVMIDFSIPKNEVPVIMRQMMDRCIEILENEGIQYDKKALSQFIIKTFPDFRKIINEIQAYSSTGSIDLGILELVNTRHEALIDAIMNKDFKMCEKWMNGNTYDGSIYSILLKELRSKIRGEAYANTILHADDQQYRHNFAIDPDICLKAFCLRVMGEI